VPHTINMEIDLDKILLSHGSGGIESNKLIKEILFKNYGNDILAKDEDAAILQTEKKIAFSTDSFTVSPLFFSGGDIGKLAVCGSCNDVAVMGAKPSYLSLSLMIEEGFLIEDLEKIACPIQKELLINGAKIVTGDTKVVPKGSVDKIFINTAAIGEVRYENVSSKNLQIGDAILVSGSVGDHGAVIFSEREGINISSGLKSDCASLWGVIELLIVNNIRIKAMRDATRGGLAAVLNEWSRSSQVEIECEESKIPIKQNVKGICEILGFEAYNLANEGMFVLCVEKEDAKRALELLRSHTLGEFAAEIGSVKSGDSRVVLKTAWGTKRIMEYPSGELLPRIC